MLIFLLPFYFLLNFLFLIWLISLLKFAFFSRFHVSFVYFCFLFLLAFLFFKIRIPSFFLVVYLFFTNECLFVCLCVFFWSPAPLADENLCSIYMSVTRNSWVRGVKVVTASNAPLWAIRSINLEFRNSILDRTWFVKNCKNDNKTKKPRFVVVVVVVVIFFLFFLGTLISALSATLKWRCSLTRSLIMFADTSCATLTSRVRARAFFFGFFFAFLKIVFFVFLRLFAFFFVCFFLARW